MTTCVLAPPAPTICSCGYAGPLASSAHRSAHLRAILAPLLRTGEAAPPALRTAPPRWILLDACALIAAGNGGAPGLLGLLRDPPEGYRFATTASVAAEVRWTGDIPPEELLGLVEIRADPATVDPRILETRGRFSDASDADASLLQLAVDDPRYSILVTTDGLFRTLPQTLGIGNRLRILGPRAFVKSARRRRTRAGVRA